MMRTRLALGIAVLDLVAFVVAGIVDPNADYGVLVLLFVGTVAYVSMGVLLVTASRRIRSAGCSSRREPWWPDGRDPCLW